MKLTSAVTVLVSLLVLAVPAAAVPYIIIDRPSGSLGPVGRTFTLYGQAMGADVVHVWAFPTGQPAVFFGAASPTLIDHARQLPSGGFALFVTDAPIGTYPVVAYAHDAATGTFPSQAGITLEVRTCVAYTMQWLLYGPNGLETVPRPVCGAE